MVEKTLTVKGRLGLHARAAAKLVHVASSFRSKLLLQRVDGSAKADAKSILSVLMLAASRGTELRALAEGDDEQEAMKAMEQLFFSGFDELQEETSNR
ncbi:MAG TPA: HPr family phosphocarrier protein [Pyrinomonadaceae bacterium]|nr:HPr family phosphocarrier protein [Pyrinomonadaceae bacterium]